MGYQDKLKPISTTTPSYQAKLKPIAPPPTPPAKPKLGDIGTGVSKLFNGPRAPITPYNQGQGQNAIQNFGSNLGAFAKNVVPATSNMVQGLGALAINTVKAVPKTAVKTNNLGVKGSLGALYTGAQNIAKSFNKGVDNYATKLKDNPAQTVSDTLAAATTEDPSLIPSLLIGGEASLGNRALSNTAQVVTRGADTSIANVVSKTADAVSSVVPKLPSITPAAQKYRVAELQKILNQSKGLTQSEAKYGKNSAEFAQQLEREGAKLEFGRDSRGRLDTEAAEAAVSEVSQKNNQTMDRLLKSQGTYSSLDDAAERARAQARSEYKGTDQDRALAHVDEELAAYKKQYASQGSTDSSGKFILPDDVINGIKQDLWSKSKFPVMGSPTDQLNAGTKYLFGHAVKEGIELSTGADDVVRNLNKRLGDIAALQRSLQKANGGAIHGNFATRMTSRIVGGIAGSGSGPLGTLTGAITADAITTALTNPGMSWAKAILARAEHEVPEILKQVEAKIGKTAKDILERKQLSAPKQINVPPPHTPGPNYNLGKPSTYDGTTYEKSVPKTIIGGESTPATLPSTSRTTSPQSLQTPLLPKNETLPQTLPPKETNATPNTAYAATAGLQPDEDGNMTFNPAAAALGFAGLGLSNKLAAKAAQKFANLKPSPALLDDMEKAVDVIRTKAKTDDPHFLSDIIAQFEKMEIQLPKKEADLAQLFDEILTRIRQGTMPKPNN